MSVARNWWLRDYYQENAVKNNTKLLFVNLGFFMGQIYWLEAEQLSV